MMRKYLIPGLLFLTLTVNAQSDALAEFNKRTIERFSGEFIRIGPYRVKGSPYLFGEAFPGVLSYRGGKVISDVKVLYNLYNQKAGQVVNSELFEVDTLLEQFKLVLPETLGNTTLLFKNSKLYDTESNAGYLNLLNEGARVAFFRQYKIRLQPDPTNTLSKDDKVFEQYFDYYLYIAAASQLYKVKLKEKDILKYVPVDQTAKDYIKKNDLNLSTEKGVIELMDYLNKG